MTAPTIDPELRADEARRSGVAKWIRRLAVPIILGWIALIAVINVTVPQLDDVAKMRAISMSPKEAPSIEAMTRVGKVFEESDSDSSVMIVLEGNQPWATTPTRSTTRWFPSCGPTPPTSSTSRISGAIR